MSLLLPPGTTTTGRGTSRLRILVSLENQHAVAPVCADAEGDILFPRCAAGVWHGYDDAESSVLLVSGGQTPTCRVRIGMPPRLTVLLAMMTGFASKESEELM